MNKIKVIDVLHEWCSCGCCVPFGEGGGVLSENYADMKLLLLENGEEVEYCGPTPEFVSKTEEGWESCDS